MLNIPVPFDSDLCANATFFPLFKEGQSAENSIELTDFVPFGQRQDIAQEALLIQDLRTGQVRMMLINQDEVKQFETRLFKRYLLAPPKNPIHESRVVQLSSFTF